ncbi:P450 heme-thiolate domain protein [Mycobacteroides abscessus MAB_030201_1075]|uniref:P450 heme-thiolate domain protein n=1 Tax=Mycobacteroides abscessus MAB_030201_1075 TaxID=1335410 RepID=A0A829PP35_9MYCO|nr:P450 heme-thiolate domain protein [Mycobacteroides abscessus MAB_030201_1075]
MGAALARLEARTAINLLLDRTREFAIKPDGAHWVPSIMVRRHQKLELEVSAA